MRDDSCVAMLTCILDKLAARRKASKGAEGSPAIGTKVKVYQGIHVYP